jgi:hypothetical protein
MGFTFWHSHAPAVEKASADISVHLRDLLRRPSESDTAGVGHAERLTSVQRGCAILENAVSALQNASEELPSDDEESDAVLSIALCTLVDAIGGAPLEFLEAPDVLDAAAPREMISGALLAVISVLAAFASIQSGALNDRLAHGLATAIADLAPALPDITNAPTTLVGQVVDLSVAGLVALQCANSSLSSKLWRTAPALADYTQTQSALHLALPFKGNSLAAAELGASALRLLGPAVLDDVRVVQCVRASLIAATAASDADGNHAHVLLAELASIVATTEKRAREKESRMHKM